MNLCLSQIKDITLGAVRIEENQDGIHFYRFTDKQEELYKNRNTDFYMKSFSTSGIRIHFQTNSQNLFLKVEVSQGSSRSYFAFDLFINGEKADTMNNFSNIDLPHDYTKMAFPLGEVTKSFNLGNGDKDICIYFPWSVKAVLKELVLDDNSYIKPQKPSKTLLCFGDSITHGYDALYPSNKYITKLANILNAEEYNKAIGGEIFFPELAAAREEFVPDYITVAYGTNDWNVCLQDKFYQNCRAFFDNICSNYPSSKVFAITPIWRRDHKDYRPLGKFETLSEIIKQVVKEYKNVVCINGFNLVNNNESSYADLRLHPNDEGFSQYFENLIKQIGIQKL